MHFYRAEENLPAVQGALCGVLRRCAASILDTPTQDWTLGALQVRLEMLENYWSAFQGNHLVLIQLPPDDDDNFENMYAEMELAYINARTRICDQQRRLEPVAVAHPATSNALVNFVANPGLPVGNIQRGLRLPTIEVPFFSGKREDWETFRDHFRDLIHRNAQLSDVERMFYLKSRVQGEAKSAIDNLQVTGANYATAWALLESRFEHPWLLIQDHLVALRNIQPMRHETAAGLRSLIDTLERHRDQLRTLGRLIESWDDWFVSIATTSIDPVTRRAWEDELERSEVYMDTSDDNSATYDMLMQFLQRRCRTLTSAEGSRSSRSSLPGADGIRPPRSAVPPNRFYSPSAPASRQQHYYRTLAMRAKPAPCEQCHGAHYIGRCSSFIRLSPTERWDFVTRTRLCVNCLRPGHDVEICPSPRTCIVCQSHHHTMLHSSDTKREAADPTSPTPAKKPRTEPSNSDAGPSSSNLSRS